MGRKQGPVERVLRKARGLIMKGWARHRFHVVRRGVDCYCALGAINKATNGDAYQAIGTAEIRELLRDETGCSAVTAFNDYSRTRKPVIKAFDRAIATAKARGL